MQINIYAFFLEKPSWLLCKESLFHLQDRHSVTTPARLSDTAIVQSLMNN